MTTVFDADLATSAIVDELRSRMAPTPVGDGEKPDGAGWQAAPSATAAFKPYTIVYGGGTVELTGSIVEPKADATISLQTSSVARTRAVAGEIRQRARAALLDRNLAPDGFAVAWADIASSPWPSRDDTYGETLPLFQAIDVIHLHLTATA